MSIRSTRSTRNASGTKVNTKLLMLTDGPTSRDFKVDDKLVENVWASVWAATPEQRADLTAVLKRADAKGRSVGGRSGRVRFGFGKLKIKIVDVDDPKARDVFDKRAGLAVDLLFRDTRACVSGHEVDQPTAKARPYRRTYDGVTRNIDRVQFLSISPQSSDRRRGDNDDARDEA